jgi:hypothetical protein
VADAGKESTYPVAEIGWKGSMEDTIAIGRRLERIHTRLYRGQDTVKRII